MRTKFFVIFLVILLQDALSASAEDKPYPRLRKVSLKKSNKGDLRVLQLLQKPSRRRPKPNIVYLDVPTDTSTGTGEVHYPSSPSTPPQHYPTTKPTYPTKRPTEEAPHGHYPSYPSYPSYPFVQPILVPVPGWTGNPSPPYVPPGHGHYSYNDWHSDKPRPVEPPYDEPYGSLSASGTPTTTAEGDEWMNRLKPASAYLDVRRKPKPSRKPIIVNVQPDRVQVVRRKPTTRRPRPSKRPSTTTTTEKPSNVDEMVVEADEDEVDDDLLANRKKKPKPTRPRPSKKPSTTTTTEKPSEGDSIVDEPAEDEVDDDLLANRKKKPKPTRPRPSKKPSTTTTTEKPSKGDSIVDKPAEDEVDDDLLANRKKRPRPSRKPRPSKKPVQVVSEKPDELTVDAPATEEPVTQAQAVSSASPMVEDSPANQKKKPQMVSSQKPEAVVEAVSNQDDPPREEEASEEVDDDQLANRKKKPKPGKKPKPSKKPVVVEVGEPVDDETRAKPELEDTESADSEEFLGPNEELIVVQRQGKPMQLRRPVNPWTLLRLPVGDNWQRSAHAARGSNYFVLG